jgi:hypothetical protein
MPKTTTTCPRCRQPVTVDVEQLFDTNTDPQAKNKLLSGNFNIMRCPNCGYEGMLATPIVYHDPEKELLLTFFPPDLGLPVNEQERLAGPMITQITNNLPAEKRKAYLFRPQTMLTMDTMMERILEADGITKEMLQAQQNRLSLLQRILSATPEARPELIRQEDDNIDQEFFGILSRVIENSMAQGDQQTARLLAALQQDLVENSTFGRTLQAQAKESEEIVKALQEASKDGLTREKLLDLVVTADSETKLSTLVSLTRTGLDYTFFQMLTERIDAAEGEEKQRLETLRDQIAEMNRQIDEAVQQQVREGQQTLDRILSAESIERGVSENLDRIDDFFVQIVQMELQNARQQNNLERSGKLQNLIEVLQRYSAPPPELALIEELLGAEDEAARRAIFESHSEDITPEFLQMLGNIANQSASQGQPPEVTEELQKISKQALRFSMQANFKK